MYTLVSQPTVQSNNAKHTIYTCRGPHISTHLTDGEHLEGIHADARVEHLQLTVATINHKHDAINCRNMSCGAQYVHVHVTLTQ